MDRYPYSIVWTPLPVISWILPLIGHTGIADSEGKIHDFGGNFYIAVDNMTFGRPTKYLRLDPARAQACGWDDAVRLSADRFSARAHNIVVNNCHHHVADTLNAMKYNGRQDYNQFDVFRMMAFQSSYTGSRGFFNQWGIFMALSTIVILCLIFGR